MELNGILRGCVGLRHFYFYCFLPRNGGCAAAMVLLNLFRLIAYVSFSPYIEPFPSPLVLRKNCLCVFRPDEFAGAWDVGARLVGLQMGSKFSCALAI